MAIWLLSNMDIVNTYKRRLKVFTAADANTRILLLKHRYIPVIAARVSFPLRLILAVILRIILVFIKPFVHIRFGKLNSPSLGGWTISTELYLGEKEAGIQLKNAKDIFYHSDPTGYLVYPKARRESLICNTQLDSMFKRKLRLFDGVRHLDNLNQLIQRGSDTFQVPGVEAFDRYGHLNQFPQQVGFSDAEEKRGQEGLLSLGMEPDAAFVCFFSRDPGYMLNTRPRIVPLYGDWHDSSFRNSSITNYISTAERLTTLGYYAVRMGKNADHPIDSSNPKVIDYAFHSHSDFMDVYLSARCSFFIGPDSGMTSLPAIFRTPIAFVNVFPLNDLHQPCMKGSVTIPKKLYSKELGRTFSFDEILSEPRLFAYPGRFLSDSPEYYERVGLEILENTPQEIEDLAVEMEQRIRGVYQSQAGDEALQDKFISIIQSHAAKFVAGEKFDYSRIRIGSDFLRNNPDWLAI